MLFSRDSLIGDAGDSKLVISRIFFAYLKVSKRKVSSLDIPTSYIFYNGFLGIHPRSLYAYLFVDTIIK